MLKKALIVFGVVYIALAIFDIASLMGGSHHDGSLLFGTFKLDIIHDFVHLISGMVALGIAAMGAYYARLYFQVFGFVYAAVAVIGFVQGHTVLGLFAINAADNYLHVAIAVASLALGFLTKKVDDRGGINTTPAR